VVFDFARFLDVPQINCKNPNKGQSQDAQAGSLIKLTINL